MQGRFRCWRGVVSCGGEQSLGGDDWSLVEGSSLNWRRVIAGGGGLSQVEGSGRGWR